MKRFLCVFIIGLAALAALHAAGAAEAPKAQAADLRLVSKDFVATDPDNAALVANVVKAYKAKTGIDLSLTLVSVPSSTYSESLNLMLMSGDVPDIIYFQGGDETVANQGLLADLRPYVASSAVMKAAMLPFNQKRLANYPYLLWLAPLRNRVPVIRNDWFEKAGGVLPVTADDYYAMLKKFVTSDYDGNGKVDSMGVTDTGNTDRIDAAFNHAFGVVTAWLKDGGAGWTYARVSSFEKSKIAFYRKLYAENILDKDYITTKWDGMEDKFYTARVGMIVGTAGTTVEIYEGKLAKAGTGAARLVVGAPAKGIGQGYAVDMSKESRGWALSAQSKKKDAAWKLLEFMASDDGQLVDRMGIEGTHWVRDGASVRITDKFSAWYPRFHEVVGWKPPVPLLGESAQKSLAASNQYATVEDKSFVMPKDLATSWDASFNVVKEWEFKFISGEYPMEKWDDYVKAWTAAGGQKVTEYANKTLK